MSPPAPYGVLPSDRFTNWRKRFWKAEQASSSATGDAGAPPASSFRREQRPFLPADLAHEEREALLVQMWKALTDAERSRYIGRDHAKPKSSISPMDALAKAADAVGGAAPPSAALGHEARSDAAVDGLAALFGADEALRAAKEEPAPPPPQQQQGAPQQQQAPPAPQQQVAPQPQWATPPPQQQAQQPLPPAAAAAALAAAALAAALAAAAQQQQAPPQRQAPQQQQRAVPQQQASPQQQRAAVPHPQQKPPQPQPARTLVPATFSSSGQLQFNPPALVPAFVPARAPAPVPHDYTTEWPIQRLPVSPSISQWKPPTGPLMPAVMPSPSPSPGPTVSPWMPPTPAPMPLLEPVQTLATLPSVPAPFPAPFPTPFPAPFPSAATNP